MKHIFARALAISALAFACFQAAPLRGEAMLQYFNTDWNQIAAKMPELAEAGYTSLWLPPPTKGSGGLSVGYDLWDRFDLGSKDQRGSIRTRYGTEAELLRMIETAHRFGIRVYFDNIMNHNAFDIPGFNASTPIDLYPGFVPEDFHLRLTPEGFYRKWDNTRDWGSAWQVQNLGLADLIDIAQEPGTTNQNFGATEGSTFPKIKFVRQPNNPEYYSHLPDNTYVGFGPGNGITVDILAQNPGFYSESVEDFLNRSARWLMDRTKADGLRLDAVKHIRADFFGATFGVDKDTNDYGYLGQVQRQFNRTRGFSDANHRDTVFDTEKGRDDAMVFGEHLGEPPAYGDYFNAGMRLVDNVLRSNLNNILGNPSAGLQGLDQPGSYGFADSLAVTHAQSHDNDYAARRELQHALYFTRAGIGLIYTDGNHQSQTLSQSGGAFPRHANTAFLGQFNDPRVPNLLYVHNQFARGYQQARFADNDFVAYERIDKRENLTMGDSDGVTMLIALNDNFASNVARSFHTSFAPGSYLWQYSAAGNFANYATVGDDGLDPGNSDRRNHGQIFIDLAPGAYQVFSWRNPEPSDLWAEAGGKPITILQNGLPTSALAYLRKDGPDGDPNFDPYNVPDNVAGSFSYPFTVPRITNASNLTFLARTDGSAENILIELDGGVDINSHIPLGPTSGDKRDHPPALSTDVFLGYEQPQFVERQYPEKFAAKISANNKIGSTGADTYDTSTNPVTVVSSNDNDNAALDAQGGTVASFLFHDPASQVEGPVSGTISGLPSTQYFDAGSELRFWGKTNPVGAGYRMFVYYTTDGSNPEGAGGAGIGSTLTVSMAYSHNGGDGGNWWRGTLNPRPAGPIKYKLGVYKSSVGGVPVSSLFPSGAAQVAQKKKMMTTFHVPNFNGTTALVYPHHDYGATQVGLSEGFHVLRARAFLKRDSSGIGNGLRSSIYNTFTQTFYYDAQSPQGEIKFPVENEAIGGSRYGVVVRTDPSVTEVWYHIDDSDASNNDSATRTQGGNGSGFEPFTDSNANGTWDAGEVFQDLNADGVWNSNIATTWVKATEVTQNPAVVSAFPREWRFDYTNIPSSGTAQIKVRLRELSSAAFKDFNLSDAAGHYTTLTRTVATAGPTTKMFVAFPANDGDLVDSNYVLKVWFSKALAAGTTTQQLIDRFLIKLASSESGSPANGVAQSRTNYSINYDVTNDYHELAFQLPNLYNDQPDFLHTIEVAYSVTGQPTLQSFRLVKARPVVVIRNIIVTPPEVDSDGKPYEIVLPDVAAPTAAQRAVPIRVETNLNATNVAITFSIGSGNVTLNPNTPESPNPSTEGSSKFWNFTWNNVNEGEFQFVSTVTTPSGTAMAARNARIVFRQAVDPDSGKNDLDDDGLGLYGPTAAPIEITAIPLPTTNSETWTNGQVHIWAISGMTDPLNPDTDGDGLADGLELGWGSPVGDTNPSTDTNGDGVPNFQPDLDPPIYNTTDNGGSPAGQNYTFYDPWPFNLNNSRTDQIAGTVVHPTRPDADGDGLNDGFEDRTFSITGGGNPVYQIVHNGRVDIGNPDVNAVLTSIAHPPTAYNTSRIDKAKVLAKAPGAVWLETDPNNGDTDADAIIDADEDSNHNGIVDLAVIDRNQTDGQGNFVVLAILSDFTQSVTVSGSAAGSQPVLVRYSDFCSTFVEPTNALTYTSTALDKTKLNNVFRPGGNIRTDKLDIVWLEIDPRRLSTSGDGLPDGWKIQHNLDPFDDGVIGHYNLNTGKIIADVNNGPNGDPDEDGFTNAQEFINGTDPHVAETGVPPPAGAITIGPGTTTTIGSAINRHEFTDWTASDLIALDSYDGDGGNFNQGDVYHAGDGFDSSRDLVAFYAHDGGAVAQGGDGNFYFRVDMHELKPLAEQGNLDIYVTINFGNPGTGEFNLPDLIDTGTSLKWQAVVTAYQSDNGRVYLWNQNSPTHSTAIGQDLAQFGVTARDQNTPNGFKKAYYNSDLDSVEFSISRQALLDAGWNGVASNLLYQVFTTRDGTQNSPVGAGDIGGRTDIRDSIRNDKIASDYWQDQPGISGANSVIHQWIGVNADNDRGQRVKIISVVHGNQAIQPGSVTQTLINNGLGAGYHRALDAHEAFDVPLTLHLTPTLASAMQWAKVDSGSPNTFRDGPAFNTRIANLIGAGTIDLLGTTFSDHILKYFSSAYNIDNVSLANSFLTSIYGQSPSTNVFWTPERVSDSGVLQKVTDVGFNYTFVDQMRHVFKWFGRNSALGNDGYRINQINNTKTFVINDGISPELFFNDDNGTTLLFRQILSRKARDSQQDQVITLLNHWEDFGTKSKADAYDKNARWLANHPWVEIVTPDQIVTNQIDISVPPNGSGDAWGTVARGTGLSLPNVSKDFIDHATEENYDNWYNGSGLEESLRDKIFSIRPGVPLPSIYGLLGTSGIVNASWQSLSGIVPGPANIGIFSLGRATFHASEFETAFHNQTNNNLSKFSTGAYISPDTGFQSLAGFAKVAQAQTREAAVYSRVNTWSQAASSGTYSASAVSEQTDVDLDGENEYLIYNDRVFALFERIGGRMTEAWLRDIDTGYVSQVVGNPVSYAGSETEEEGAANFTGSAVNAFRTSGFKDWFAQTDMSGAGTSGYVNDLYSVVAAPSGIGWKFISSDGKISKTVTLAPNKGALQASYATTGLVQLFMRFGLSPDLLDLLLYGQNHLAVIAGAQEVNVFNHNPSRSVRAYLRVGGGSFAGATYNGGASDLAPGIPVDTLPMRNQAQTQQVEIQGNTNMTFALGFETGAALTYDTDGDGLPDWWETTYGFNLNDPNGINGANGDVDGDGRTSLQEYILGTNPNLSDPGVGGFTITRPTSATVNLTFPTLRDRVYKIFYRSTLATGTWMQAGSNIAGTGSTFSWTDNGSQTGSAPTASRLYKLEVSLVP